jgi:hypothetical protein
LRKHGYDFADSDVVYDSPGKVTLPVIRGGEARKQDIALVEIHGKILTLMYDAAVEAYFKQATIFRGYPDAVLIQKDGVPVAELTEEEIREAYAAAPGIRRPRSKAS